MIYIQDSSAMIAFLRKEPGADVVEGLLLDPDNTCFAHAINLCEVFYDFRRPHGEATAQDAIRMLFSASLLPRTDMDPAFWQEVGRLKADHRRVSLADCFCIALAQRAGGEIVTCDHHEFDAIVLLGLCRVRFIR